MAILVCYRFLWSDFAWIEGPFFPSYLPHPYSSEPTFIILIMAIEYNIFWVRFCLLLQWCLKRYWQITLEFNTRSKTMRSLWRFPFFDICIPCIYPLLAIINEKFFAWLNISCGNKINGQCNQTIQEKETKDAPTEEEDEGNSEGGWLAEHAKQSFPFWGSREQNNMHQMLFEGLTIIIILTAWLTSHIILMW